MDMATKVRMLLVARNMSITELASKLEPKTSNQNISQKLKRNSLSENELIQIAKICDATFESNFILNDTGKEI